SSYPTPPHTPGPLIPHHRTHTHTHTHTWSSYPTPPYTPGPLIPHTNHSHTQTNHSHTHTHTHTHTQRVVCALVWTRVWVRLTCGVRVVSGRVASTRAERRGMRGGCTADHVAARVQAANLVDGEK